MYKHEDQKINLYTDEGQRMFLRVRDHVKALLAEAGAVRMDKAMQGARGGDSWDMLACVDRMVELGELIEIKQDNPAGQHRIFTRYE